MLECVDRWGSLLGPEVPGNPTVGIEPNDWRRESPGIVDFFTVVWVFDKFADVSGVTGASGDARE